MSEQNPEPSHQDPAEPNELDTEVETVPQPEPGARSIYTAERV